MKPKAITPILNVSNLQQSFDWFEKLGWEKKWDWGDPASPGSAELIRYDNTKIWGSDGFL